MAKSLKLSNKNCSIYYEHKYIIKRKTPTMRGFIKIFIYYYISPPSGPNDADISKLYNLFATEPLNDNTSPIP